MRAFKKVIRGLNNSSSDRQTKPQFGFGNRFGAKNLLFHRQVKGLWLELFGDEYGGEDGTYSRRGDSYSRIHPTLEETMVERDVGIG